MKISKIIKKAPVRGVFTKPEVEIEKSGDSKIKNLAGRDLFIPGIPQEKITYGPFFETPVKQKSVSREIYSAFMVIVEAFLVEQAENDTYFSPEQTRFKILKMIKLLINNDKHQIKDLRTAVIRGFVNAEKNFQSSLPNTSYKTLELVLHDIDEILTE